MIGYLEIMHALDLMSKEEGRCIVEAIDCPNKALAKDILLRGLKNVEEITVGGKNYFLARMEMFLDFLKCNSCNNILHQTRSFPA